MKFPTDGDIKRTLLVIAGAILALGVVLGALSWWLLSSVFG
jgi:hypothetical protein